MDDDLLDAGSSSTLAGPLSKDGDRVVREVPGRVERPHQGEVLPEDEHLEAVLEITDSLLTYRARYLSSLQLAQVIDLLLTDETNPHSVLYQVMRIRTELARLPKPDDSRRSGEERSIHAIEGRLLSADVAALCAGEREALHAFNDELLEAVWAFSDGLTERYFSHAGAKLHVAASPTPGRSNRFIRGGFYSGCTRGSLGRRRWNGLAVICAGRNA